MLFHVLSCLLFYVACLLFPRVEMNVPADRSTVEWMPAQSRGSRVIPSVRWMWGWPRVCSLQVGLLSKLEPPGPEGEVRETGDPGCSFFVSSIGTWVPTREEHSWWYQKPVTKWSPQTLCSELPYEVFGQSHTWKVSPPSLPALRCWHASSCGEVGSAANTLLAVPWVMPCAGCFISYKSSWPVDCTWKMAVYLSERKGRTFLLWRQIQDVFVGHGAQLRYITWCLQELGYLPDKHGNLPPREG